MTRYKTLRYLFFALLLVSVTACEKEPIPTYIHIPYITVKSAAGVGSTSSNISNAWVYINGQVQGVYELPATFPVLASGETEIGIYAGIKLNGISNTRAPYPFYNQDIVTLDLEAGATDTIYPEVSYVGAAEYALLEDFELSNAFSQLERTSAAGEVFEGIFSAKVVLDTASITRVVSSERFSIPRGTTAAFVELDYKSNQAFTAGINAYQDGQGLGIEKVVVNPQSEWNKIYFNFTPEVNNLQADEYEVVFSIDTSNVSGTVNVLFDNIKLIYFQ
ncbi:MAG: hypothetical protein SFW35_04245 [Chitinophagales bacterium]|nr:hypothetical protein [Chitinophagales bacterium]